MSETREAHPGYVQEHSGVAGMMAAAPSPLPTPGMRRKGHVLGSLQRLYPGGGKKRWLDFGDL